jgi:hypothetical protein
MLEPKNFNESSKDDHWVKSMNDELDQIEKNVDTERGVNQYQVQFKNLFQLILKPFNYIQ